MKLEKKGPSKADDSSNNLVGANANSCKPCVDNFNKLSKDDERRTSQVVGHNCVAPDRPDIQYVVHSLAGFLKEPTKAEQHLCLYLQGPATKELV